MQFRHRLYKDSTHTSFWGQEKYTGGHGGSDQNFPMASAPLRIPADRCVLHFHSDGR